MVDGSVQSSYIGIQVSRSKGLVPVGAVSWMQELAIVPRALMFRGWFRVGEMKMSKLRG